MVDETSPLEKIAAATYTIYANHEEQSVTFVGCIKGRAGLPANAIILQEVKVHPVLQKKFGGFQKYQQSAFRSEAMARRKPLTIAKQHFKTQMEANAFIRELLNGQPLKTPIPEPHHSFLCALIARHPRAAEKIDGGIDHFTVEPALHGTRCFYLTRVDGTRTDFSYFKCVQASG